MFQNWSLIAKTYKYFYFRFPCIYWTLQYSFLLIFVSISLFCFHFRYFQQPFVRFSCTFSFDLSAFLFFCCSRVLETPWTSLLLLLLSCICYVYVVVFELSCMLCRFLLLLLLLLLVFYKLCCFLFLLIN